VGPIGGARFAAGACVAFPPTGADRHQTVFLDAGHGGPDPGAIGLTQGGRAVDEAGLTLSTALAAVPVLQGRGYRVVMSRTGNSAVGVMGAGDLLSGTFTGQGALKDLTARAACANLARAASLVSIHFNAGGSPANAGMLTLYDEVRPFSARSLRLASLLHSEILAAMNGRGWGIPDSGVRNDGSAGGPAIDAADRAYGRLVLLGPAAEGYLATPSEMPGAVVEPLFITDPFEASIAAGETGQQAIAGGIARAVDTFLGAGG
jgi:N-acetylmuramoyl-L-alanine amidase